MCAAIVDRPTVGGDIIETRPPHPVTPGFTDTTATGATPEFRLWLKCPGARRRRPAVIIISMLTFSQGHPDRVTYATS